MPGWRGMLRRPKPPMPTHEQRAFTHLALSFVKGAGCADEWLRVSALNAEMAAVFAKWALLPVDAKGRTGDWLVRPADLFSSEQLVLCACFRCTGLNALLHCRGSLKRSARSCLRLLQSSAVLWPS
jgi:hypothetical protein